MISASLSDDHTFLFCWMIVATGCRISEALSLTLRSIDVATQTVVIESLKKRRRSVYRTVPVPAELIRLMVSLPSQNQCVSDRYWTWSRMTGYRRIRDIMAIAGISGGYASPKGLRHAFGVRAVQSNIPLSLVQRWLGHADIKTTAIYTSVTGPEERDIASRMWASETFLKGRRSSTKNSRQRNRAILQQDSPSRKVNSG